MNTGEAVKELADAPHLANVMKHSDRKFTFKCF